MSSQNNRLIAFVVCQVLFSATTMASDNIESNTTTTTQSESKAIESEKANLQWGLSEQEYARYQTLMKGIRGSISPSTISPLEVLGIHAKNDAERMKYARMMADEMEKDTERVLAFNRAYNQAWSEKGHHDLIDTSKLSLVDATPVKQASIPLNGVENNLLLLTSLENCDTCNERLQKLLNTLTVDDLATLDIYFVDSQGKSKGIIRQWVQDSNIDVELLKNKRITLNNGEDMAAKLNLVEQGQPFVFKKDVRGGLKRVE